MTLPPERVQVVGYLEQCLLGEVFDVRTSTAAQSCSQPPHKQIVEVCKRLVRVGSPQLGEPLCVRTFSHLNLILSRILVHRVIAETALLLPTVLSCRRTRLGRATFLLQNDSFPHRVPYSARGGMHVDGA
jgi:hypothetical protein